MRHISLFKDRSGITTVEFALLSIPLLSLLMGSIEMGYIYYTKSLLEGTVSTAARMATTGGYTGAQIDTYVTDSLKSLGIKPADIAIEKKSYSNYGDVGQAEPLVSDVVPLGGAPGSGDCYLDINGNSSWDEDRGSGGLGGSEDVVKYDVTVNYGFLFPLVGTLFNKPYAGMTLNANTVIKNEPFGTKVEQSPKERCIT